VTAPRYRWTVLAVGCVATMVTGAIRQGMPALGPEFREVFGLGLGQIGLLFAVQTLGFTLGLVPWGALADRTGERPVLGAGLTATAGALALAASAGSFGLLLGGLFLTGFFGSSATGASGRAIMGWFRRSERGFVLGIRQTAIPIGGAITALTLPPIAIAVDLRTALLALAGFALAAAVVAALWMRDPPSSPPPPGFDARPPMRDRRIWRLGLGSGLLVMAQASIIGFTVLFLVDEHGFSTARAALVLATIQVVSAVCRIVAGRWSDRSGRRIEPMRHIGMAGGLLVGVVALLAGAPNAVLVPLLVLGGAAISSWNGLSFTAAAEIAGRARAGTAMSLQNMLVSISGAIASPLFGLLVEATSYRAAFLTIAAAPVLGWFVLRPLETDEEERAEARRRRLATYAAQP
jgi:sugar phosphate permease